MCKGNVADGESKNGHIHFWLKLRRALEKYRDREWYVYICIMDLYSIHTYSYIEGYKGERWNHTNVTAVKFTKNIFFSFLQLVGELDGVDIYFCLYRVVRNILSRPETYEEGLLRLRLRLHSLQSEIFSILPHLHFSRDME